MKRLLLSYSLMVLTGFSVFAQMGIPKAQAMFIFNFSRLVEWPATYRNGPFVIGVLGATTVGDELDMYTKGKKVGVQDIQIARFKSVQEISTCHILFVPFAKSRQMAEIFSAIQGKSILIITEKNGALNEGSAINFIVLEDKLKFELKAENASRYGIKLSSKLTEMSLAGA
jgi:hypothetical protein